MHPRRGAAEASCGGFCTVVSLSPKLADDPCCRVFSQRMYLMCYVYLSIFTFFFDVSFSFLNSDDVSPGFLLVIY